MLVYVCIQRMAVDVLAQESEQAEYIGSTTVTAYVMEAPQSIPEDVPEENTEENPTEENDSQKNIESNAKTGDDNKVPELILMLIFSMILLMYAMRNLLHN